MGKQRSPLSQGQIKAPSDQQSAAQSGGLSELQGVRGGGRMGGNAYAQELLKQSGGDQGAAADKAPADKAPAAGATDKVATDKAPVDTATADKSAANPAADKAVSATDASAVDAAKTQTDTKTVGPESGGDKPPGDGDVHATGAYAQKNNTGSPNGGPPAGGTPPGGKPGDTAALKDGKPVDGAKSTDPKVADKDGKDPKAAGDGGEKDTPNADADPKAVADKAADAANATGVAPQPGAVTGADTSAPTTAPSPEASGGDAGKGGGDGGGAVNWDNELGWHDTFKGMAAQVGKAGDAGGGGGGKGGPASMSEKLSMIGDALGGGALEGAKEGAVTLLVDTAINMASSKIPYLGGFVEMARIAHDPSGWAKNAVGGTWGKASDGVGKIFGSGSSIVDRIEGVLNIVEAATNLIGLISSVLWIVAGAGFIISLFFPALLPFVALAAQWAMAFGKVGTLLSVFVTVGRALVMAGRSLEILTSDASVEDLKEKQASLKEQTTGFTKEWTVRAGHSVRERVQTKLTTPAQSNTPPAPQNNPTPQRSSVLDKVINITSGNFRGADGQGNTGWRRDAAETGAQWNTAKASTDALKGNRTWGQVASDAGKELKQDVNAKLGKTTPDTRTDTRSRGQVMSDMEAAGAHVFVNKKHEEHVDKQLQATGGPGTTRMEQLRAQERLTQANEKLDQAKQERTDAKQGLADAKKELTEAQKALADAKRQNEPSIEQARNEVNARRALVDELNRDVNGTRSQLAHEQEVLSIAQDCKQRTGSTQYDQTIAAAQQNISNLNRQLSERETFLRDATAYHQEGVRTLADAQKPVQQAQTRVDGAQQGVNTAQGQVGDAKNTVNGAYRDRGAANNSVNRLDTPTNRAANDTWTQQADALKNYRWYQDMTGGGPFSVYGQNNAAGVTGNGVELFKDVFDKDPSNGDPSAVDAVKGFGSTVSDMMPKQEEPPQGDFPTPDPNGPQTAQNGPDPAALQARLQSIVASLPEPPLEAPGEAYNAQAQLASLETEEAQLQGQKGTLAEITSTGQSEIAGLTSLSGLVETNKSAVDGQATALQERTAKQDEAIAQAQTTAQKGDESKGKANESQGQMGFMGSFLSLMSKIPEKVTSKGAQAGKAGSQLSDGSKQGDKGAGEAAATAKNAQSQVSSWKGETTTMIGETESVKGDLSSMKGEVETKTAEAGEAMGQVSDASAQADARIAAIAAEKERLRAVQAGATQRQNDWVQNHSGIRLEGMAELENMAGGK